MMRELELLDRLIAFPTVSDQSNNDLIDWVQTLLQNAGFQTSRMPSPDRKKAGLHATVGPQTEGGLCLSAHTDVVPVAGQKWTRDPFKLTRGGPNLYGRGATDMKGFVACALAAAERTANSRLNRPFSIVLSYDEEIGCVGIRDMLPELKKIIGKPEVVIVGEPTSMQIATGHKGKAAFAVTCHGEAGHSAMAPRFRNAIHLAARFVEEIRKLQREVAKGVQDDGYDIPYSTFHIGKINGGKALNVVPDTTTIEMEIRYLAQASLDDLTSLLCDAAKRVCEKEQCTDAISIELTTSYPGFNVDFDEPFVKKLQNVLKCKRETKVGFGTEAGYFAKLGLNSVVLGPGDMAENGHKPDEFIKVNELEACASAIDQLRLLLTE